MKKKLLWSVVLLILLPIVLYPGSYAALRVSKVLVRREVWTISSGRLGHMKSQIRHRPFERKGEEHWLEEFYAPLAEVELMLRGMSAPESD